MSGKRNESEAEEALGELAEVEILANEDAPPAPEGDEDANLPVPAPPAALVSAKPDSEVERRVLSRRLCSDCGLDYNLIASRPRVEDVCDVCGGTLVRRPDDHPEALASRLRDYHDKTQPVIELFERKEFVARIDATQDRETVFAEIVERLQLPAG